MTTAEAKVGHHVRVDELLTGVIVDIEAGVFLVRLDQTTDYGGFRSKPVRHRKVHCIPATCELLGLATQRRTQRAATTGR